MPDPVTIKELEAVAERISAAMRPVVGVLLLLVVLLCVVGTCVGVGLPPIRIPVIYGQYVRLTVGEPGRALVLRLRWDLNISYLYDTPDAYSATYQTSPIPGGNSTELFELSKDLPPVRLPVVYGQEDPTAVRPDTNDGVTFSGNLGLGSSSAVWLYWTSFTISKFTLTLGEDDSVDTLEGGDEVHSYDPYFSAQLWDATSSKSAGDFFNDSIALAFDLTTDFTLVPLAIFANVSRALQPRKRIAIEISDNCTEHHGSHISHDKVTVWLGRSSSVVINPWGRRESALRVAERVGANSTVITLGRIHITGNFVLFYDFVKHVFRVRQVFDTFPSVPYSEPPQAFLSVIPLVLYVLWRVLLWPSLYHWLRFGLSPRQTRMITNVHMTILHPSDVPETPQKPIGDDTLEPRQQEQQSKYEQRRERLLNRGPIDWLVIQTILNLTRLCGLGIVYVSVWGFHSARFSAHFAQLGGLPHQVGEVFFWLLVALVGGAPLMINAWFIRKYTHAGINLITVVLAGMVWLAQLPDTTSTFASLSVNLIYSLIVVVAVWEWPISCLLRGPDSRISSMLRDAGEFDPTDRYSNKLHKLVIPAAAQGVSLPQHHAPLSKHEWLKLYTDDEAVLIIAWCLLLLPLTTGWFVMLNFLPIIEQFPTNSARFYGIIALGLLIVVIASWFRMYRVFLQQMQECSAELQQAVNQEE